MDEAPGAEMAARLDRMSVCSICGQRKSRSRVSELHVAEMQRITIPQLRVRGFYTTVVLMARHIPTSAT